MKHFPLFKVHVPIDDVMNNIRNVLESGFINEGSFVTQFSNELQKALKADNLIVVNSCTSALTLALHLSGVGHDDEVISTPMTCVATNTPIANRQAKIVWSDIDSNTGMIDASFVEKLITEKTKAIIAVAWAGTPPNLNALRQVCDAHNIPLILDAAHAFAAEYDGKPIHEWADYTCYSFQAIKHVTTGDGGALICRSNTQHQRSKALKWFGLDRDRAKDADGNWKGQQWDVDIIEPGYKFNMNNVAAAIGLAQINYIDHIIESHRKAAELYNECFQHTTAVRPVVVPNNVKSSHWVYTLLTTSSRPIRDELLKRLNSEGIMAGLVHVPNDDYTAFLANKVDLHGVRRFSNIQFSLPCGWWLTNEDVKHIANRVISISEELANE